MNIDRDLLIDFINFYLSGVTVNYSLLHKTPIESVDEFIKSKALASNPKEPEAVHGNEAERGICPECICETLEDFGTFYSCVSVGCHYRKDK